MSTEKKKSFDLRARRDPVAGSVILNDGNSYDVLKCNGLQYQRVEEADESTPISMMYEIAEELIPSAPKGEVRKLDKDQLKQVVMIASQGIAVVEALFPNEPSPAT